MYEGSLPYYVKIVVVLKAIAKENDMLDDAHHVSTDRVHYKYRKFDGSENSINILRNQEIYFPCPGELELNDPLDCRPSIESTLNQIINDEKNLEQKSALIFLRNIKANCSFPLTLCNAAQIIAERTGVLALSSNPRDALLWAHYADSHRGFCIGFDIENFDFCLDEKDGILFDDVVMYEKEPPYRRILLEEAAKLQSISNQYGQNSDEFIKKALPAFIEEFQYRILSTTLGTKSEKWAYECEYRIVRQNHGALRFSPQAVQEVIFGLHASPKNEADIREILNTEEWKHVRFKKPKFTADSFDFEIVDF